MQKILMISMGLLFISCATVVPVGDGRTHVVICPSLFTSMKSCAYRANDKCPSGLIVTKHTEFWDLKGGSQRAVTVKCKKPN
jgi:hypothetical protein